MTEGGYERHERETSNLVHLAARMADTQER